MTEAASTTFAADPQGRGPNPDLLAAARHHVTAEVQRQLAGPCGVHDSRPVVAGVSGGADSVALLIALTVLHRRGSIGLPTAVHVHHHLRENEADADAEFVSRLAQALAVPVRVEHIRPAAAAGNTARQARDLRYDALGRAAVDTGAAAVAVAHHADDQLETLLIALCRGAGPNGMRGMRWRRPLAPKIDLVRPLLGLRRLDCEAYCEVAGIAWRHDVSNDDVASPRMRLRRDVLPVLEALWPTAPLRATAAGESFAAAADAFDREVEAVFGAPSQRSWSRSDLRDLPIPVVCAGLRRAALASASTRDPGDDFGQRVVRPAAECIASSGTAPKVYDWPGRLRLSVTNRNVELLTLAEG